MNILRALCLAMIISITACFSPAIVTQMPGLPVPSVDTGSVTYPTNDPTFVKNGPAFKIIPDSELVDSPAAIGFNLQTFIQSRNGFLNSYSEVVDGLPMSAVDIIDHISREYSVNPRILLALIESQSHWISQERVEVSTDYPLGLVDTSRKGLYRQLSWAANILNRGYYLKRINALNQLTLLDGQVIQIAPSINPGTAAVQYFYSWLYNYHDWQLAVSALGVYSTFLTFFGDPAVLELSAFLPDNLTQPFLQLPFEKGEVWSFTSGPHSAWGDGAAWAALDFAPPGDHYGCNQSDAWIVASADGLVVRSENGMVVQDLDGDGYEQTGWTILYQHVATRDRVPYGTMLHAGERIGHPSCEGGPSSGTHLHIARRYNGEWIPADQSLPFNLDGWISQGKGKEYDGTLIRNGVIIEAIGYYSIKNQILR